MWVRFSCKFGSITLINEMREDKGTGEGSEGDGLVVSVVAVIVARRRKRRRSGSESL